MNILQQRVEEAQFRLDHGDPELSSGMYAGNRTPTQVELNSWIDIIDMAEYKGVIDSDTRALAGDIITRWTGDAPGGVKLPEKAVLADFIWTLTCSLRLGLSDAPTRRVTMSSVRAARRRYVPDPRD